MRELPARGHTHTGDKFSTRRGRLQCKDKQQLLLFVFAWHRFFTTCHLQVSSTCCGCEPSNQPPDDLLLAHFSLYVHKGDLKPDSFHFLPDDHQGIGSCLLGISTGWWNNTLFLSYLFISHLINLIYLL